MTSWGGMDPIRLCEAKISLVLPGDASSSQSSKYFPYLELEKKYFSFKIWKQLGHMKLLNADILSLKLLFKAM